MKGKKKTGNNFIRRHRHNFLLSVRTSHRRDQPSIKENINVEQINSSVVARSPRPPGDAKRTKEKANRPAGYAAGKISYLPVSDHDARN